MRTTDRFTAFITSVAISAVATFALLSFFEAGDAGVDERPIRTESVDNGNLASPTPTPIEEPPRFAILDGVNRAGGYGFRYPPGWDLSTSETVSTLTSPNGNTVVTIGFGAPGNLDKAAAAFASLIRETYDVSSMQAARQITINALPARVSQGAASNADGVRVLFQAFTIRAGAENFAISVFSRKTTGPAVDEIVGSFGVILDG